MMADWLERAKHFLRGRAGSYGRVFAPGNQDAEAVLRDLARFCRAHTSTAHIDPHVAARLDGRREVWLRIQMHLNLDTETLWRLHGAATPTKGDS